MIDGESYLDLLVAINTGKPEVAALDREGAPL